MYKCQYIYTYIKNGNWIILGQMKRKSQNVSKVGLFEFSTQDSSPKSLKHQLVAFYVLNNNFFYSQVVFANIFFFSAESTSLESSSWESSSRESSSLESSSLEFFFVWIFSRISSWEFFCQNYLHQNQKKFLCPW